jgi:hypothetical protein
MKLKIALRDVDFRLENFSCPFPLKLNPQGFAPNPA